MFSTTKYVFLIKVDWLCSFCHRINSFDQTLGFVWHFLVIVVILNVKMLSPISRSLRGLKFQALMMTGNSFFFQIRCNVLLNSMHSLTLISQMHL